MALYLGPTQKSLKSNITKAGGGASVETCTVGFLGDASMSIYRIVYISLSNGSVSTFDEDGYPINSGNPYYEVVCGSMIWIGNDSYSYWDLDGAAMNGLEAIYSSSTDALFKVTAAAGETATFEIYDSEST